MKKYTFDINYILSGLAIYFSIVIYANYRLSFEIQSKWFLAVVVWLVVVVYFRFKKYCDYGLMVLALSLLQVAIADLMGPLSLSYAIPQLKPWLSVVTIFKFEALYDFIFWTYKYLFIVRGSIPNDFDLYLTLVVYYGIARLLYPTICSKRFYPLILLTIPVFSIIWTAGDQVSPMVYNTLFIGLLYFFIVKGVTGQVYMSREFGETREYPKGAVAFIGIAISLIIVLVANGSVAISQREKINDLVGDYMPSIFQLRNEYQAETNQFFDFSSTIYQTGDVLGGRVEGDLWREVMTVETEATGIYIKGFVSNVYDGKRWTTNNGTYFNKLNFVDQWNTNPQAQVNRAQITYTGLESTTVFAPAGILSTDLDYERFFSNSDQVSYYKQGILSKSIGTFEVTFTNQDDFLDESVDYLTVPETVTEWVYEKTATITSDLESDEEKMAAIESYLRDNYTYRLDMEETPYDVDFVSYFLSEQGSGYCTYFASASAIMGRIAGIPTRYVEGYVQPTYPDRGDTYVIRSKHAHAWVEAYIDGKGWMPIDGTPIAPDIDFRSENYGVDMELDALMGLTDLDEIDDIASDVRDLQGSDDENTQGFIGNMVLGGFNFILFAIILLLAVLGWFLYKWYMRYEKYYHTSDLKIMIYRKIYYSYGLYERVYGSQKKTTFRELLTTFDVNDDIIILIEKILYGHYDLSSVDIEPINALLAGAEAAYKEAKGQSALMRVKYIKYDEIINHQSLKLELKNGNTKQENTA